MKRTIVLILTSAIALLLLSQAAAAADKAPERKVHGSTITSAHDPAVRITLPATAKYLGADRWDLYGICDAELHVFVEADAQKRVQRLYWIQFEGYLPNNTDTYGYPFTETLTHAGLKFDVKARFGTNDEPSKPGSDREHVWAMITKAGFQMPAETMNVRLVHLPDETKRKELMFIYVEDLAPTGMTVAQLEAPEGKARWDELKAGLIGRAQERIEIAPLK